MQTVSYAVLMLLFSSSQSVQNSV